MVFQLKKTVVLSPIEVRLWYKMGDFIGRKVDIDIDQVAAQMIIGSTKAPKINDLTEKVGELLLSFQYGLRRT